MSSMHHYAVVEPGGALRIVLPVASPSLNQVLSMFWASREREKKQWAGLMLVALAPLRNAPGTTATGKRTLTIIRYGKRVLDEDNGLGGAKKVITDNLVTMGLLKGDTPNCVKMHFENGFRSPGVPVHTVILLEDV